MIEKCLLIGGGLDSFAVAIAMQDEEFELLHVNYGQINAHLELKACKRLADLTGRTLVSKITDRIKFVNYGGLLFGTGTDPIVKLRNIELIHLAACEGYTNINLALLNERGIMFPDANAHFMEQVGALYKDAYDIVVRAPYVTHDKYDFVCKYHNIVPFFNKVFTCWNTGEPGCECAHCQKLRKIEKYYEEEYVRK